MLRFGLSDQGKINISRFVRVAYPLSVRRHACLIRKKAVTASV